MEGGMLREDEGSGVVSGGRQGRAGRRGGSRRRAG